MGVGLYNKRDVGSTTRKLRAQYSHMGGCQNDGPFLNPYYNTAPIYLGYPERDHNFDSHPYDTFRILYIGIKGFGFLGF